MQTPATTVLLVEDNEHFRTALAELLSEHGYAVTVAESAEEGLEKLRASRFNLVLTDQQLPGQTGAGMLQEARAAGLLADTGVRILTGHQNPVGTEGWKVLKKPIPSDELLREMALAAATQGTG